jgi:hypothetical protein
MNGGAVVDIGQRHKMLTWPPKKRANGIAPPAVALPDSFFKAATFEKSALRIEELGPPALPKMFGPFIKHIVIGGKKADVTPLLNIFGERYTKRSVTLVNVKVVPKLGAAVLNVIS